MSKRKNKGKQRSSAKYHQPNHSVMHISNSRSKSNKHAKRGVKGRDCIFFNADKHTCDNELSLFYRTFCNHDHCNKRIYKNANQQDKSGLSPYDEDYIQLPSQAGRHDATTEYIAISRNIGTPCHIGYLKSDGVRRHKSRCIYYRKDNKHCTLTFTKCKGSSHCNKYTERAS